MSRIQWKGMSQHARTVVIALVAFVIGCFVQAEFDRGAFPGVASGSALAFLVFVPRQGWRDAATGKSRQ